MNYDIAIIGGGIIGSSAGYFLSLAANAGRVCVIEPDPTYARASTPHGAGGVRRLFSRPENVAMSQFSLDFYADFANNVDCGTDGVDISFRRQGYLL
jgi:FAD-dependent oxidoreductase domain-containing protein 1